MKQRLIIAGLLLVTAALPGIASAEEKPIYQQEVERVYPQQNPPPPANSPTFYNPSQDMAPPMAPPPQGTKPYYVEQQPKEGERRRPSYNSATEPTAPENPQPDYIAPKPSEEQQAEEKPEASNGEEVEGVAENAAEKTDELPGTAIEQEIPKWEEKPMGSFKVLNKVYTRNKELKAKKGEIVKLGALNIKLEKCFRMPESDKKESSALLLISETFTSQPTRELFHGWMFSSSPAISALEHPLYDVILLGCEDEEKKTPAGNKEAAEKDAKDTKTDTKKDSKKDSKKDDTKKTETKPKTKAAN